MFHDLDDGREVPVPRPPNWKVRSLHWSDESTYTARKKKGWLCIFNKGHVRPELTVLPGVGAADCRGSDPAGTGHGEGVRQALGHLKKEKGWEEI